MITFETLQPYFSLHLTWLFPQFNAFLAASTVSWVEFRENVIR